VRSLAAAADEWRTDLARVAVAVPLGLHQYCKGCQLQVLWRFWDDADNEAGLRHNLAREERANVGIAATVSCVVRQQMLCYLAASAACSRLESASVPAFPVALALCSNASSIISAHALMPDLQPNQHCAWVNDVNPYCGAVHRHRHHHWRRCDLAPGSGVAALRPCYVLVTEVALTRRCRVKPPVNCSAAQEP
jgi:hypothetical protein